VEFLAWSETIRGQVCPAIPAELGNICPVERQLLPGKTPPSAIAAAGPERKNNPHPPDKMTFSARCDSFALGRAAQDHSANGFAG
jgi:hypothetical protein